MHDSDEGPLFLFIAKVLTMSNMIGEKNRYLSLLQTSQDERRKYCAFSSLRLDVANLQVIEGEMSQDA